MNQAIGIVSETASPGELEKGGPFSLGDLIIGLQAGEQVKKGIASDVSRAGAEAIFQNIPEFLKDENGRHAIPALAQLIQHVADSRTSAPQPVVQAPLPVPAP